VGAKERRRATGISYGEEDDVKTQEKKILLKREKRRGTRISIAKAMISRRVCR